MQRLPAMIRNALPAKPKGHVLFVDDDRHVREAFANMFLVDGFHTSLADNGQTALELLDSGPRPDVILLDLMMPVMDGWTFLDRIVGTPHAGIPVIVLSGIADSDAPEGLPERFGCQVFRKGGGLTPVVAAIEDICKAAPPQ